MKLLVTLLLPGLLLTAPACAQTANLAAPFLPADSLTNRIKLAGVVEVPGVPAAELQARARQWVALTFEDAHQVTQYDDEARGVLILRGYTAAWPDEIRRNSVNYPSQHNSVDYPSQLGFTLRLDFRPGRYRYEITDLSVPLYPRDSEGNSTPYLAAGIASRQAREVSAWQLGATATLEVSPRRALLQPLHRQGSRPYDIASGVGPHEWPLYATFLRQNLTRPLDALGQYVATPPARW